MDPLSILRASVALAVFPGFAYTAALAWLVARVGRLPRGRNPVRLEEALAALAAGTACGLLAFPGSPLNDLPVPVSLSAVLVSLAAAVAWGTSTAWNWHRVAAAAVTVSPLLCLGESGISLNLSTIVGLPGRPVAAARLFAAAAALIALPLVARPFDPETSRLSRAMALTAISQVALSLIVAGPLSGGSWPLAAGLCATATIGYAALLGGLRLATDLEENVFAGLAAVPAAGSILLTLLTQ
jgi:hypothetical protein